MNAGPKRPIGHNACVEYERFSEIYSVWTSTAPSARANHGFYVDTYLAAQGPIVELGVGDGRIAIDAALEGCDIIGVDSSPAMLALCRNRAVQAGVDHKVTLVEGDFRSFTLGEPAGLIALPYHSIGHLQTFEDKQAAIRQVASQLRPGGVFVFDDFVMTPARLSQLQQVQLRAEYTSASGRDTLLWVTSLVNASAQTLRVVTWEDELDADGTLAARRYRRLSLSWLEPAQAALLLADAGLVVDACYGDFTRAPFDAESSPEQIWLAHKDPHA